jgi:hypothetical protein
MSLRTLKFILPGLIVAVNVTSADLDNLKHPCSEVPVVSGCIFCCTSVSFSDV